jgi:fumarylpyruvate hydrolase
MLFFDTSESVCWSRNAFGCGPPLPLSAVPPTLWQPRQVLVGPVWSWHPAQDEMSRRASFLCCPPSVVFTQPLEWVSGRIFVPVAEGETGRMPYPSLTKSLHHEVELVVAIGTGGRDIKAADAMKHVWGYAVGLDMTRRDLQGEAKKLGRPWDIGKGFDHSAPIGPIYRAADCTVDGDTRITLEVNGVIRQQSTIGKLIWDLGEVIEHLSAAWELAPGDLIFSGTPEGVAAVEPGDMLRASVDGVGSLQVQIVAR